MKSESTPTPTLVSDVETATYRGSRENETPAQTSSEKLKSVDKKTFLLFAGYVFWAMIFISGGATAVVLLLGKKSNATQPQEPEALNQIKSPTPAPSEALNQIEPHTLAPSSSTCPVKKPEPGDLCLDPGLVCDYEYRNLRCDEGGLLCYPTEHFHCISIGDQWNLAVPDFFCEGGNFPSTFLDPCTAMEP